MKTLSCLLAAAALLVGSNAPAQASTNSITFTNKSGGVIRDAKVVRVLSDGLLYRLEKSGGKVLFVDLPVATQEEFGFDRAAWSRQQAAFQAANQARAVAAQQQRSNTAIYATRMALLGNVRQILDGGILFEAEWAPERVRNKVAGVAPAFMGRCFVAGATNAVAENRWLEMVGYPDGKYTYKSVAAGELTVVKFQTNPAKVERPASPEEMKILKATFRDRK